MTKEASEKRPADADQDDEVLALRSKGASYGRIATQLNLGRAANANEAFLRALRRRPKSEQTALRESELTRLASLEAGVNNNADLNKTDRARRLQTIGKLRERLLG